MRIHRPATTVRAPAASGAALALLALTSAPHAGAQRTPAESAPPLSAQSQSAQAQYPHSSAGPLSSVRVHLPTSMTRFPPGEGAEIANSQCLLCHSAGMVLTQPVLSVSQWQASINKMRTVYGAPLPAAQVDALAAYLSKLSSGALSSSPPISLESASHSESGAGAQIFAAHCSVCHQLDGQGIPGVIPPLGGSAWMNGSDTTPVKILLHGLSGPITVKGIEYRGVMPEFGNQLSDSQIAQVLSYARAQWGNTAGPVTRAVVAAQRAATAAHRGPWAGEAELAPTKDPQAPR
jgi:mono/diheme cytochrome c family protein